MLVDAELSDALQISRTPIREAIVSLTASKLVEVYPQKSSIVSRIDLDAVEEGVFLRVNTECAILKEAVHKANRNDIAMLKDVLSQQKECLSANTIDVNNFMDLDNEFHKLIYLAADKPWTWTAVSRIVTHYDRIRRMQIRLGSEALKNSYKEHCEIFNAIMTRSEKDMNEFMYEHITQGYRNALPELMEKYPDYFAV